jgi:hypothetical protein
MRHPPLHLWPWSLPCDLDATTSHSHSGQRAHRDHLRDQGGNRAEISPHRAPPGWFTGEPGWAECDPHGGGGATWAPGRWVQCGGWLQPAPGLAAPPLPRAGGWGLHRGRRPRVLPLWAGGGWAQVQAPSTALAMACNRAAPHCWYEVWASCVLALIKLGAKTRAPAPPAPPPPPPPRPPPLPPLPPPLRALFN